MRLTDQYRLKFCGSVTLLCCTSINIDTCKKHTPLIPVFSKIEQQTEDSR